MGERRDVRRTKRVVIKIGSKTLAADRTVYARLAAAAAGLEEEGRSLVIVSSGAIALGMRKLGKTSRPKEIAGLQAAAAAGQSLLMRAYEESFEMKGLRVAQVLLTHADLADRERANNARGALMALLDNGVIPVLNENDSVAVEEIKFGDNDQLAAMVTPLVGAELLLLMSDVEGLLDDSGQRIASVPDPSAVVQYLRQATSSVGSGGMKSKLEAARRATLAGAHVIIADARSDDALTRALRGEDVGTHFPPSPRRISARKHWIAFTLRPRGDIILDRGASEAVQTRNKSVLYIGVLGVRGSFAADDAVRLLDPDGQELGRGLARASTLEVARLAGQRVTEPHSGVVVHRDDIVTF